MFWTELVEIYCIQSKKLKSQVQLKFVMLYGVKIYIKNVDNILKQAQLCFRQTSDRIKDFRI